MIFIWSIMGKIYSFQYCSNCYIFTTNDPFCIIPWCKQLLYNTWCPKKNTWGTLWHYFFWTPCLYKPIFRHLLLIPWLVYMFIIMLGKEKHQKIKLNESAAALKKKRWSPFFLTIFLLLQLLFFTVLLKALNFFFFFELLDITLWFKFHLYHELFGHLLSIILLPGMDVAVNITLLTQVMYISVHSRLNEKISVLVIVTIVISFIIGTAGLQDYVSLAVFLG